LSQIAGQFFQCIPVYEEEQQEQLENPRLRFLTCLKMNSEIVSKGYGPNKREAKIAAVTSLLNVIAPNIFK